MLDLVALFDEYEHLLLVSPAVARFSLLKRRVLEREGYIRVRAELVDGGLLEFSEFWASAAKGDLARQEYAYHQQNAKEQLVRRWDNVNHHPHLPFAPHHAHLTNGKVEGVADPPDLAAVLREIEKQLGYT
jgi:hypothetical protein